MSERGRVIAIFAAVAAVAAGGGYYFLRIYRPQQVLNDAREEIGGWETRFAAARACLLGPTPASSKTSEALAIREMNPDPWDRGRCTPLISKLSRGEAPDSGLPAVEAAWADLDRAAAKAASAFATHVASSTTIVDDPLPAALDGLDAARAKLRAVVELPPAAQSGKPLPAAQIVPLQDGAEPITKLELDELGHVGTSPIPSAHGFVTFGKTASREVQITLTAGGPPRVGRVAPGGLRAVPDGNWGATAGDGEVSAGAFDAEGAMPAPSKLPLAGSHAVSVAAAAGTLAEGVILYGDDQQLAIAHAHQSALTADSPIRIFLGLAGVDVDGRIALAWTTGDREHHARILRPSGDDPVEQLTELVAPGIGPAKKLTRPSMTSSPCLTQDRAWLTFGTPLAPSHALLVGFGGGKPATKQEISGELIGCAPDAAVVRTVSPGPIGYTICSEACRSVTLPGAPDDAPVAVVGGKLVAIGVHGGVLAMWREGAPPAFYGLPEAVRFVFAHDQPAMALTDGKVIDVLARGAKTFVVVRLATGS